MKLTDLLHEAMLRNPELVDPESPRLEAVQYGEWGVWHAVRPTDDMRTFCGLNAAKARRMWEDWAEHEDRCQRCVRAGAS